MFNFLFLGISISTPNSAEPDNRILESVKPDNEKLRDFCSEKNAYTDKQIPLNVICVYPEDKGMTALSIIFYGLVVAVVGSKNAKNNQKGKRRIMY